jgi:hypothetical protein
MCLRPSVRTLLLGNAFVLAVACLLNVDAASADDQLQYNRDVRPILADHCFACHGADSASRKADLRIDLRDAAIDGGAIVEGDPDNSELIARVMTDDPELVMPPPETKKTLTAQQKEILSKWIAAGAEYQPHWSLIAPQRTEASDAAKDPWVKNPIDGFVLEKLRENGLEPTEEADPRTLIRRLHLDITGLPPSPESIDQFVKDYADSKDNALSQWIDRLMASPAWGEHQARYWLDAARYADTHGMHFDNYREMWPYRDWVIRAFNANQPFDQFTIEQIAGDLLPSPTTDQLIATGFQRCNITTNEGGTIDEENLALYATDRVQTLGWVYMGLTVNCCQCHDHKFDPLTMKDYYSLAAFFRNTTQPAKDGNVKDGRGPVILVPSQEDQPRWEALPAEIAAAVQRREERRASAKGDYDTWLVQSSRDSLRTSIPTEGLIVNIPLTEGTGNTITGTCSEETSFVSTGDVTWKPDGKLGPAAVLKAGSTFDLGSLGDFEIDQSFSYGGWIRPGKEVSGGVLARMDEQNSHRGWDLWQEGRSLAVHIIDSWPENSMKVTTKQPVLTIGQWQHVIATYDGSGKPEGITIYVDGKPQPLNVANNTLKTERSIRTTTNLRIGQRSQQAVFDEGSLQDLRIYDRKLTEPEVKTLSSTVVLQTILATEAEKRTPEQQATLLEHYLNTVDPQFPMLVKAVTDLESEREAIRGRSPVTHIQEERKDKPAMANMLIRGEYDRPSDEVPAATPAVLHQMPEGAPANRLGLAQWLVDPNNTLTSRVTVNRFWQQVFGRGIVFTPDDFGVTGALPSHPHLIDWLAIEFRESGWDVKHLFKLMLMSATYRQSSTITPDKLERDRDNQLLSRGPRYRMDAEMIRDAALASSGLLSGKMFGPSVRPYQPEGIWDVVGLPGGDTRNYAQDSGENLYRRSLYTFLKRMAPPPNLEALNATAREVCTVQRERTNTPLQALVTLNDPQFIEAARNLAQLAITSGGDQKEAILDTISQRVLGRKITPQEQAILVADFAEFLAYYQSTPADAEALLSVGESKADSVFDKPTLAAWTMVCNQVMNLDENLCK